MQFYTLILKVEQADWIEVNEKLRKRGLVPIVLSNIDTSTKDGLLFLFLIYIVQFFLNDITALEWSILNNFCSFSFLSFVKIRFLITFIFL